MKITIICGSHRDPSESEKVSRHIERSFSAREGIESEVITLAGSPIPLWEEAIWNDDPEWKALLDPYRAILDESDAFVIVSPEYHGQVPSALKNFFLMFNRFQLGHKPAYIVAVSNGPGGSYPVAELRMSSYKNNRLCYIPEQLIVRDVEKVFNDGPDDNDEASDSYYKERLEWGLDLLIGYGKALREMRQSTEIFHDKFGNGM